MELERSEAKLYKHGWKQLKKEMRLVNLTREMNLDQTEWKKMIDLANSKILE